MRSVRAWAARQNSVSPHRHGSEGTHGGKTARRAPDLQYFARVTSPYTVGFTFAFSRKRFVGSYLFFTATSRSWLLR